MMMWVFLCVWCMGLHLAEMGKMMFGVGDVSWAVEADNTKEINYSWPVQGHNNKFGKILIGVVRDLYGVRVRVQKYRVRDCVVKLYGVEF